MDTTSEWVIIGRFGRPHGIKGLIRAISFTDPYDNIMQYDNWHAKIRNELQALKLLHLETGSKFILTKIDGYDQREDVAKLSNVDILVARAQLPLLANGEYYWYQLIGMQVINNIGIEFGSVQTIMATGANDVLVVIGEKRHLIPYLLDRYIIEIDTHKKIITVDWDYQF